MVNMAVAYAGPSPAMKALTTKLRRIYGNPARTYEFVTGYKSPGNITSHNADANGLVHAVDIFVGPGNLSEAQGIDLAERLRAEGKRGKIPGHPDRLAYIIHRGLIAGDHTGWEWIPYTGADWHGDHIHVSAVFDYYWGDHIPGNPADYNSSADWDLWETELLSGTTTPIQEDDMANVPQADWENLKIQVKSLVDNVATKTTINDQTKTLKQDLPRELWAYKNPGLGGADAYQILRDAVAGNDEVIGVVSTLAAKAAAGGATEAQIRQAIKEELAAGVNVDVTVGGSK